MSRFTQKALKRIIIENIDNPEIVYNASMLYTKTMDVQEQEEHTQELFLLLMNKHYETRYNNQVWETK